jgi:hypothetical protein
MPVAVRHGHFRDSLSELPPGDPIALQNAARVGLFAVHLELPLATGGVEAPLLEDIAAFRGVFWLHEYPRGEHEVVVSGIQAVIVSDLDQTARTLCFRTGLG